MTIQEAVKNGTKIRRKHWDIWYRVNEPNPIQIDNPLRYPPSSLAKPVYSVFTKADLLGDDWEAQDEKIEITKSDFMKACCNGIRMNADKKRATFMGTESQFEELVFDSFAEIMKELGFLT